MRNTYRQFDEVCNDCCDFITSQEMGFILQCETNCPIFKLKGKAKGEIIKENHLGGGFGSFGGGSFGGGGGKW